MVAIGLPNGIIISHLNETPLIHGGSNYLSYTEKELWFGVAVQDFDKHNDGEQYFHNE